MSIRPRPGRLRGSARTAAVLGLLAGVLVTALVTLDPFELTTIDERLRGLDDDRPRAIAEPIWTCPMHPQIIESEPGSCPICGMDLVPVADDPGSHEDHAKGNREELWTCPMHPAVVEPTQGSCPICGMDLVPMAAEPDGPTAAAPPGATQGPVVRIDPAVQQNMNLTTETVRRRDIRRTIRTVGYLNYDEDRMVTVTTKYAGYVEKVFVNYLGQPVGRGEPLFEVFSPELVQTQQELLSAVSYAERLSGASPQTRERAEALVEAARQRLEFWDVSDDQIEGLIHRGAIVRTLEVAAPASGVVMKRMHGLEGMRIVPGMDVIHIAGLDTLWLAVEVYTNQLPWIREGSTATVTLTYLPGETFTGRVRFVEPEVSETTRTVRLTLEVPNPGRRLRVGMYATVVFEPVEVRDAVTVPSQSVLRTGERNVVVVALGDGSFAPREVTLGREGDGVVQVLDGLEAGDTIVTSAQFLIDSESNLREAILKMAAASRAESPTGDHRH
ncbi:MAG: efflux RND transporter periplasmic adaptor subunit [Thermoanaerobaculales bacterium]|jgi:Cu(I)/Ag(I) efflux system membrane fusion protein/cobalt-zinc-cadmium efflux system membrane fusion protein|nr:efflux RND transporter periplasmic adaptor subunit [Thermoanaerobaculales bacterium]